MGDVFGGEEDAEEDSGVVVVVVVTVVIIVEGSGRCHAQWGRAGDESVNDGEEHRELEHVVEEGGRDEENDQSLAAGWSGEEIGAGWVGGTAGDGGRMAF